MQPGAFVLPGGRKNCGGTSFFTSLYFAFCTSPTISIVSLLVRATVADVLADDGVAAQVELLRERLVDDRDFRRAHRVGSRELASREQRHPERLKIGRDR